MTARGLALAAAISLAAGCQSVPQLSKAEAIAILKDFEDAHGQHTSWEAMHVDVMTHRGGWYVVVQPQSCHDNKGRCVDSEAGYAIDARSRRVTNAGPL